MRAILAVVSVFAVLVLAIGCHGTSDYDVGDDHAEEGDGFINVAQAHHREGHTGGPPSGDDEDDEVDDGSCSGNSDCEEGYGCTQGGTCIDITGEESVTEVLQGEIDELDEAVGMGVPYELPTNARLRIDAYDHEDYDNVGLLIDEGVILEGNGSKLLVENDVVGIRLNAGASRSSIADLHVEPQRDGREHEGIGIDVRAHGARLDNLYIRRMGTGIRAHTRADDLPDANVNMQQWSRIVLQRNFHKGMHVQSRDSNAGLFTGIDVRGGGGIVDESFLGNTYVSPTVQNESEFPSFKATSNAAATTTLGLYVESGAQIPRSGSLRDMHVGGNAIRRFDSPGGRVGGLGSQLRFSNARHEEGNVGVAIPRGNHAPIAFSHAQDTEELGDNPHMDAITESAINEMEGNEDDGLNSAEWRLMFSDSWNMWTIYDVAESRTYPFRWTGPAHRDGAGLFEVREWLD